MTFLWFKNKIDIDYLKLSQIAYGGEFFYNLKKYQLKDLIFVSSRFKRISDNLLKKSGNNSFYSFKNENSGFVATLFENKKTKELIIAYRGTERIGLGENSSDLLALGKDIKTDLNLVLCNFDEQFEDAYEFYWLVKEQNPKSKITIIGQSLGGALAQLVSAKVYSRTGKKLKTFTYNAPGCKHLLEVFGCNLKHNYSFIINYAVMNDWCGMFGEKIGSTYLIPPIAPNNINSNSPAEILENVLLTSHEGIFDYSGEVIKKPRNFNQAEGLALWYYDINNPIKDFATPSSFINFMFPQINNNSINNIGKTLQDKFNTFIENQNDNVPAQLQVATKDAIEFIEEQKDKFFESINNNTFNQFAQVLDASFEEVSQDSLKRALGFLKQIKINKKQPEYYNSFRKYIEQ